MRCSCFFLAFIAYSLVVVAQYPNTPQGQAASQMFEINWDPKGKNLVLSFLGKPVLKTEKNKRSTWRFHFVKEQKREKAKWQSEEDRLILQPPKLDPPYHLHYEIHDEQQGWHDTGEIVVPPPNK